MQVFQGLRLSDSGTVGWHTRHVGAATEGRRLRGLLCRHCRVYMPLYQQSWTWKAKLEQMLSCWTVKGEHVTGTSAVNREPQRRLSVWAADTRTWLLLRKAAGDICSGSI